MPLPTNSDSRALGKGKKFFVLKFGMTKKSWCPEPTCKKFSIHSTLWIKKFQKFLDLKFSVTKKIQSPELFINKKIPQNFLFSNLAWPKKVGALNPLAKNSASTALCKLRNS